MKSFDQFLTEQGNAYFVPHAVQEELHEEVNPIAVKLKGMLRPLTNAMGAGFVLPDGTALALSGYSMHDSAIQAAGASLGAALKSGIVRYVGSAGITVGAPLTSAQAHTISDNFLNEPLGVDIMDTASGRVTQSKVFSRHSASVLQTFVSHALKGALHESVSGLNSKVWYHGTSSIVQGSALKVPIFLTTSEAGARWYASNRGAGHPTLYRYRVQVNHAFELGSLEAAYRLATILKKAGVDCTVTNGPHGWTWDCPAVAHFSPYDGENPIDVVFVPNARVALQQAGYDAVYDAHDRLDDVGSIEALALLTPALTLMEESVQSFSMFCEAVDLATLIVGSGAGSDYVHDLYSDDAEDAIATNFNLNTVTETDIERAKTKLKNVSQDMLHRKFGNGPLTVYRGVTGSESKRPTVSVTLQASTARYHGHGNVQTYSINIADVLSYGEAIGRGTYAEEEIVVFTKALKTRLAEARRSPLDVDNTVYYHGSPSGKLVASPMGIHVGTHEAAKQALNARIGVPAVGEWDGTRTYGMTKIAGRKTLRKIDPRGYNLTGYNASPPDEDYLPTDTSAETAKYSDGSPVSMTARPIIFKVKVVGAMKNTPSQPVSDDFANSRKRSQSYGYYYSNVGEDVNSVSVVVPDASFLKIL